MEFGQTAVQTVYLVGTITGLVFALLLWRNRELTGAVSLCVAMGAGSLWTFGLLLSTLPWEVLAANAIRGLYLFVGTTVAAMFVFGLEYTGRERYVTPPVLGLLAIHPLLLTFFAIVNPADLFFTGLETEGVVGVDQQWGPAFWVHSAYSYLLVFAFVVMMVAYIARERRTMYRGQALTMGLGLFAPLPFNALFLGGVVEFDTTPLGMLCLAAFFTVAVVRYEFTNISPIARRKVIDNVRDGMLVVDTGDRIVDTNAAAQRLLEFDDSSIGEDVTTLLADVPGLQDLYEELTATPTTGERTVRFGDRHLTVQVTPIEDDRNRHVGWLFLIQDVTERVRRERDLEQQIERLDMFASIVSHDLRNPINVAKGYIDQTEVTNDLEHLEKSKDALDRMEDIIEDVLTLTRDGGDVTEPTEVDVERLAREAWENVDTGEAQLVIDAEDEKTAILADESQLLQLFENLFRNSIEHGIPETEGAGDVDGATDMAAEPTAGHRVTVGTTAYTGSEATLYVADNGAGIPPDKRDKVFEDGYTTGGTGLGLTIVSQIAEAHGWEEAVTESEDDGARFEFHGVGTPIQAPS